MTRGGPLGRKVVLRPVGKQHDLRLAKFAGPSTSLGFWFSNVLQTVQVGGNVSVTASGSGMRHVCCVSVRTASTAKFGRGAVASRRFVMSTDGSIPKPPWI